MSRFSQLYPCLLPTLKLLSNHSLLRAFLFFSLLPFPKVSLFPRLLQLFSAWVTFSFPSWKPTLPVPFYFFLQITSFCLLLPLIANAVWKFAPLSFPQYGFCSLNHALNFPSLEVPNFPITILHHLLLPCPDYSNLSTHFPSSNFTTFVPCNISSPIPQSKHPFVSRLYHSCCLFTGEIFNTLRILAQLNAATPSRIR